MGSTFQSTRWSTLARFGQQGLRTLMLWGLAWLLQDPQDPDHALALIGVLGSAMLVRELLDMLGDFGVGQAVLREREPTDRFLTAAFTLNLGIGLGVAGVILLGAPLLTLWFRDFDPELLVGVLRGLTLSFLLGWMGIVHRGLLMRAMRFDVLARVDLTSTTIVVATSLGGAAAGYGIWGFVWGQVLGQATALGLLLRASPFRPRVRADLSPLRDAWRFMRNLLGFNLLNFWTLNLDRTVVGRLGDVSLGQYDMTLRLVLYPVRMITQGLASVLTSAFARLQADDAALRERMLRAVSALALLAAPMSLGLAVVAGPLVGVLLPPGMTGIAATVRILAPLGLLQALTFSTGSLYLAKGRTDWLLRWSLLTLPVIAGALALGSRHGVEGVCWALLAAHGLLSLPALMIPFRLIELPLASFLRAVAPACLAAVAMAGCSAGVLTLSRRLEAHQALQLAASVSTGVLVYGGLVWILRLDAARDLLRAVGLSEQHRLVRRFGSGPVPVAVPHPAEADGEVR